MSNDFPTKLSELHLTSQNSTSSIYSTLKQLKRTTLSLHNRLRSILIDAEYVSTMIRPAYADLPLLANERCGSWYIPPHLKGGSAYFKSTDGHHGAWAFSLRRLNLQVLEVLGSHGGAVLVDSTRRGKRMPDALRRTVPIWVRVWNHVLFADELKGTQAWSWAFELQHPGLEPAEVRLIERRVDEWVDGLRELGLDLVELKRKLVRPVRLCWVVQGEDRPNFDGGRDGTGFGDDTVYRNDYNLLVLCSASKRVLGAEMSENGYVQGAADDAEGWSGGLTSSLFWQYAEMLMAVTEEELPELLERLIAEGKTTKRELDAIRITPTENIFVAGAPPDPGEFQSAGFDLVICCNRQGPNETSLILNMGCRPGKLGSKDLRQKLPLAVSRATSMLERKQDGKVLIVCENGKDLSIGLAVTLLCLLYDDEGRLQLSSTSVVDKQLVKKRLAWITSVDPGANPSRSTLQAVNSFLMS